MTTGSTTLYGNQYDPHQTTRNVYRRKAPTTLLNISGTTSTLLSPISSSSLSTTSSSILTHQEDKAMTRECLLFPTYACRNPQDPSEWVIRTRGWALSHNRSQAKQKFVTSLTKGVVGQNSGDHATFEERFKYFLAKNKRNKHFTIRAVGTHPLPFETWNSSSPTTSTSSSSSALPITPTDNIPMAMNQQRRDSDGSTDSGFQSSGVLDKDDRYNHIYRHPLHYRSSRSGSDEDEMVPTAVLDMERPVNPLSSILSGERMRSTTSLSSSLLSTTSNDSKQYHGDNDDDDDDNDDNADDDDDDDINNNYSDGNNNIDIGNKTKYDHYLTNNTTHSDTSTTTLSSLFTYPSFRSTTTTSNSSTFISQSFNNNIDSKVDGQAIFKSENSGFFSGPTHLSHQQVLQWAKERDCCDARLLELRSSPYDSQHLPHPMDIGQFPESSGMVNLVEPTGISIISDIDDTIKETQILHGARTVLNNTFFNPSKGVSGMAEAYMKWYTQGASFHYVSNSPFQLLPFLHNFLNTARFPPGSMHLRLDGSLMARLVEIPGRAKRDAILSIMRDFPQRQFILVGDSGEIDLEIYTKIALENPGQILKIFIHDVTTPYAERKKRNKKSAPSSPTTNTKFPTTTKSGTDDGISSSDAHLTNLAGSFVRNNSMPFSSILQSQSTTSSRSNMTPSSSSAASTLPLSSTTSSASLLNSDQHTRSNITTGIQKHHKHKTNSLLDLASSITSSSVLGIGRGRTKTLAELIIEPSSSSSSSYFSSSANAINPGASIPPSQQCIQLYDRIRKAQDQLQHNVEVVLFKNADDLRDDTLIQEALWQHWDDQCINTII